MPLTTNRNNPKVKIVSGRVKITKIGLTIALTSPITTAASNAAPKLLTPNPGTTWAVMMRETAVTSQVNKKCGIGFLPLMHYQKYKTVVIISLYK